MPVDVERLSSLPLLAGLSEATRRAVADACSVRRYRRRMLLFSAGEPSEAAFFVLAGRVRIFRSAPDGHEQTLQVMGPGQLISPLGFLDAAAYPASAETVEDSELGVVRNADFARLVQTQGDLAWALLVELGGRLLWAQERIYDFALRGAGGRVASALLGLAHREGEPSARGPNELSMPLTHRELAQLAGISRETATRLLQRMKRSGAVDWTEDGRITVDRRRLGAWLDEAAGPDDRGPA